MNKIIRPRIVALDSSHLGAVARDKLSKNAIYRERAVAFERAFEASGNFLLLCWHHVQELLSHRDKEVVEHRIAFIRMLPVVAVIRPCRNDDIIGSVIDLQANEAAFAFKEPNASVTAIRDEVAKFIFSFERGIDIIRPFIEMWPILQTSFVRRQQRQREVVAISRSGFVNGSNNKIFDLIIGEVQSQEEIARRFQEFHRDLTQDIQQYGDKRIPDAERSSAKFLDEVRKLGMNMANKPDTARQILVANGIYPSDIGPDTTVGDVGVLATFRTKLFILNKHLGLPWPELIARVTEDRLPSGVVQSAVARFCPDTRERKGSDLTDGYLACLSAYADVTYTDRRTHEALRIAQQKSTEFAALARRVAKAGGYQDIIEQLSAA